MVGAGGGVGTNNIASVIAHRAAEGLEGAARRLGGEAEVRDDNVRVVGDLDDAFGYGVDDREGQCFSKESHTWDKDSIALNDRSLGKTSACKTFDARAEFHLLFVGHDR